METPIVMENLQSGQVLLIVVLVMTVALTVTLSVVTRSIVNIRTSTEEANSEQAFSAAEAGIERAMSNNTGSSGTLWSAGTTATYQTSVTPLSGTEMLLNNDAPVLKDNPADVWLSQYDYTNPANNFTNPWSGNLTIYWGTTGDVCSTSESSNTMAALEVILITGTKANPAVAHYVFDPCQQGREATNNFTLVPQRSWTINGQTFAYQATIPVSSGLIARIIPLYAPAEIGVSCDANGASCSGLPAQGTIVSSVGTADKTQRKIVSFRSYPKLPMEVFPFILFSSQ